MHPNRAFAWDDEAVLRAFVADHAFAQICTSVDGAPLTAQAPLAVHPDGSIRFHLARGNAMVPHLDGAVLVAMVWGEDAYISPDWYGTDDQVPTWNYQLVEVHGRAHRLDQAGLIEQLDTLSAAQEARLAPKPAWTSAKMDPMRMAAMAKAIVGFAIDAPVLRGIAKLGQNKRPEEVAGAVNALRALGNDRMANRMEDAHRLDQRQADDAAGGVGRRCGQIARGETPLDRAADRSLRIDERPVAIEHGEAIQTPSPAGRGKGPAP